MRDLKQVNQKVQENQTLANAEELRQAEEVPTTIIEPTRSWLSLKLRDIWQYRELLYFLTWRDVKVRYKQTVIGFLWAIIQPFLKMVVFSIIFGSLAKMDSEGFPYPIFLYAGLLPWQFFASAVSRSGESVVGSANLIKKVYFPRLIIPIASVGACLVDFAISFIILIVLMFSRPVSSGWKPVPTSKRLPRRPFIIARPLVGSVIRESNFKSVLFPAPFLPMIPTTSPCFTSKETSFRAQMKLADS